jgi:hypothetical protein
MDQEVHGDGGPPDMGERVEVEDAGDRVRKEEKALLREYHVHGTTLGHRHWSVSEKTWREWLSDRNKKRVPRRVLNFIEGEARYDRGHLQAPGVNDN